MLCRRLGELLLSSCNLACDLGNLCSCRVCIKAVFSLDEQMHAACCNELAARCCLAEACKSAKCASTCCLSWQSMTICCRLPGSQATPSWQAAASTTHGMLCKRVGADAAQCSAVAAVSQAGAEPAVGPVTLHRCVDTVFEDRWQLIGLSKPWKESWVVYLTSTGTKLLLCACLTSIQQLKLHHHACLPLPAGCSSTVRWAAV